MTLRFRSSFGGGKAPGGKRRGEERRRKREKGRDGMAIVAPFDGLMVYRVGTNLMPGGLSADVGDYRDIYYE